MTEVIDREEFKNLCDRLMADGDAEVLGAAREIKEKLTAAGLTWDDILAPADDPTVGDADFDPDDDDSAAEASSPNGDDDDDDDSGVAADEEEDQDLSEANADALATIKRLLERSDISEALREELEEYQSDIANGEFDTADRKYVKALVARLKSKK